MTGKLKTLLTLIIWTALSNLALANSLVVSTVKTPDAYTGNQSWFRFYSSPGSVIKDSIIVKNLGDQTEKIKIYSTDATSNQSGSFNLKADNEEQKGVGLWTKVEKTELTLQPGDVEEVAFEIKIPKDLSPGQYFGGIINEQNSDSKCDQVSNISGYCTSNIQIKTRTGNRIYLTIPGEIKHDIKLNSFSYKQARNNTIHFHFSFTNKGNTAFEPRAIINIYDQWNKKIATINRNLGKSLPNSTITPIVDWSNPGHFGNLTAKAEIYYEEDNQGKFDLLHGSALKDRADLSLLIIPFHLIYVLGTLIIALGLGTISIRIYLKKIHQSCEKYEVQEGDNLIDLAKKFKTNWRLIAFLNKIKAPYIIEAKQRLRIPNSHKNEK